MLNNKIRPASIAGYLLLSHIYLVLLQKSQLNHPFFHHLIHSFNIIVYPIEKRTNSSGKTFDDCYSTGISLGVEVPDALNGVL